MESQNRYDGIDGYAVTKIRYQARRLARSRVFGPCDIEDLEQELMLDLLRRLPAFESGRASFSTFIARIVENCAATLIEAATAEKRGAEIVHESLDASAADDEDGAPLEETIAAEDGLWSNATRTWHERVELRHDLQRLLSRLSPGLVDLCNRLATRSVSELARSRGISRASIYGALAEAREAAIGVGLYGCA